MDNPPTCAPRKRRVLFIAEAVTLAHVARPLALTRALPPDTYEVRFAAAPHFGQVIGALPRPVRPIRSLSTSEFKARLARGRPLYSLDELRSYVREDLEVIREILPDVVVGDFRISLAVSARLAGVPYLAVTNAYWSPYAGQRFPLPVLPFTRFTPLPVARSLFRLIHRHEFRRHCVPLEALRSEHHQASLGWDLRRAYTEADYTLYADVPELWPTHDLPAHHHYLGPVLWQPDVPRPEWWAEIPPAPRVVYVNLGSSGDARLLPAVLRALEQLPVTALAATAGMAVAKDVATSARLADYLPGGDAAARSALVVCNGGSPATHQALAAGVPVLGICSNMDQFLNMRPLCQSGAGSVVRADRAGVRSIRKAVERLLHDQRAAQAAEAVARVFKLYDAGARFRAVVEQVLNHPVRP